jgi:hypothetical protein
MIHTAKALKSYFQRRASVRGHIYCTVLEQLCCERIRIGLDTVLLDLLGFVIILYVTDGNIMYLTDASRFLISCVIQHYAPVVGWGGVEEQMHNVDYLLPWTLAGDKHYDCLHRGSNPCRLRHRQALYLNSYQDSL